jgi:hypothetical protein
VLVYRESLPVDENGIFTGEAIASGDYFPKDSDIEDIYQSYVDNWLDRPYLARETRIKNKDLTLIATSEPRLFYDADEGITPDIAEFEYKRAHVRFVNNAIETKKIYNFEIKANVLIRKKIGITKASPLGTETDLLEYTSQYIFDNAAADALAEALAFDALAEEQYSFGLNVIIELGSRVNILEQRNETDVEAIIQKARLSGKSPVIEYEAIQFLYEGNLQLNHDYHWAIKYGLLMIISISVNCLKMSRECSMTSRWDHTSAVICGFLTDTLPSNADRGAGDSMIPTGMVH